MLKEFKELSENIELDKMLYKLPEDEVICRAILKDLNNENVKIRTDRTYSSSLYTIFDNTITIGRIKSKFLKPQTIAHECRHSVQNKFLAWTNFIISNVFLFLYLISLILLGFNIVKNGVFIVLSVIGIALIQWIIRTYLEIDAILNAKLIAIDYLEKNKILDSDGLKLVIKQYSEINKIGIKFVSAQMAIKKIIEILILIIIL